MSEKKTSTVAKHTCKTCHGTGREACPECGGKKEVKCKKCKGVGYFSNCNACHNTGKETCVFCNGTGKEPCEVCHGEKKITRKNLLGENYKDICPNCNGRGHMGKKCHHCNGTGELTCSRCHGTGKAECKNCHGTGIAECDFCHGRGSFACSECRRREIEVGKIEQEKTRESYQNRGTFIAVGLAFGLLGVHYAYVRRWFMLLVQIILTTLGVIKFVVPAIGAQIENLTMPYSIKLNEAGYSWLGLVVQNPLSLAVLWCLFGVIFIRKDGTNHKMTFNGGKVVSRRAFIIFSIVCIAYFFLLAMCFHLPLRWAWLAVSGIPFIYACRWKFFFVNLLVVLACAYGLGGNVMLNIYGWGYLLAAGYVAKEL